MQSTIYSYNQTKINVNGHDYIKTYFIALKQVKLGCWFEMGCYDTDLSMLRIPQLDLPQKPEYQAISSS